MALPKHSEQKPEVVLIKAGIKEGGGTQWPREVTVPSGRRASLRGGEGSARCQSIGWLRRMTTWSGVSGPMWGAGPEWVWGISIQGRGGVGNKDMLRTVASNKYTNEY